MRIGSSAALSFAGSARFVPTAEVVEWPVAAPVVPPIGCLAASAARLVVRLVLLAGSFAGVGWLPVVRLVLPIAFVQHSYSTYSAVDYSGLASTLADHFVVAG